jgi:hypothetical protein
VQWRRRPALLWEGWWKCTPNGVILLENVDMRWCDTIVVEGVVVRPTTMVWCHSHLKGWCEAKWWWCDAIFRRKSPWEVDDCGVMPLAHGRSVWNRIGGVMPSYMQSVWDW